MKFTSANRIARDGTPLSAASLLGLFCLPICPIKDARLIWVKHSSLKLQIRYERTIENKKCLLDLLVLTALTVVPLVIEWIFFLDHNVTVA